MPIFHRNDSIILLHKNMAVSDNGLSLQAQWLLYGPPALTLKTQYFFPESVFNYYSQNEQ
jgi:hypothetical protein